MDRRDFLALLGGVLAGCNDDDMARRYFVSNPLGGGQTVNVPLGTLHLTGQSPASITIAGPPPAGAFIPQPGFTVTGNFSFDGQITITNTAVPLSAAGPIRLLFDDFRGGSVGGNMGATITPVTGIVQWQAVTNQHGFVPATYGSPNRTGGGFTMRLVRTTDATFNPVGERIAFGQETTGIYIFWAEKSYGGNYNTFTNANGNNWNYKMHWLTENTHTGGAFNQWIPAVFSQTNATQAQFNIASNDIVSNGGPQTDWFTGDGSRFDPNNWNSCEMLFLGTPGAPFTGPGLQVIATYNQNNVTLHGNGQNIATNTGASTIPANQPLFSNTSGANGTYASANDLEVPGTLQGFPTGTQIDRADYGIQIGPNCAERYLLGNAATIQACTSLMYCDPVSWSSTVQTINLRAGVETSPGFPAPITGQYLYRSDGSNNYALVGQVAPVATFDFYISATGSDGNAGTVASPWAITALSSHPEIAGKRVGLLSGTYILTGTGTGNGGYIQSLSHGGPSSTQPTYIASVTPLGAVITTNNGGVYPQATAAMFGVNADNITIDGIKFFQGSFGAILNAANNTTIKNCHLEDFDLNRFPSYAASFPGDNIGCIFSGSTAAPTSNLLISNCLMKHVRNGNNSQNESVCGPFYSQYNTVIEYCTIYDGIAGVHWKTASGLTVRNCFISQVTWPLNGITSYNSGGSVAQTKQPDFAYNNICIGAQMMQAGSNNTSQTDLTLYNNTFYANASANQNGSLAVFNDVTAQAACHCNFYNNIWNLTTSQANIYTWVTGSGAPTPASMFSGQVLDYNCYTGLSFAIVDHVSNTTYSSLAAWRPVTGQEAHSVTSAPAFVNPSVTSLSAADFQLQATSPLKGAGRIGGLSTGAATDMGAWGGLDSHTGLAISQIGSTVS